MDDFVDYYELLQISPNAELLTIQRVYKMLASRYHPDNVRTGDTDKFLQLQKAFQVLSDPDRRAQYNRVYESRHVQPNPVFETKEFEVGLEAESNRRLGMLCLLYQRRKTNADHPGMSLLELETMMQIPREHLEFTCWYLREKEFIRRDEDGEFLLSAKGADQVESNSQDNPIARKLLKSGRPEA